MNAISFPPRKNNPKRLTCLQNLSISSFDAIF